MARGTFWCMVDLETLQSEPPAPLSPPPSSKNLTVPSSLHPDGTWEEYMCVQRKSGGD